MYRRSGVIQFSLTPATANDYKWKIVLNPEASCDQDEICGHLEFSFDGQDALEKYLKFDELRLDIEGRIETSFVTQLGSRPLECCDTQIFYPAPITNNNQTMPSATVFQFIRRGKPLSQNYTGSGRGTHIFPFQFSWLQPWTLTNGLSSLLPSFSDSNTKVVYELIVVVAFIQDPFHVTRVLRQEFELLKGWLNLCFEQCLSQPVTIKMKKGQKTSMFSRKPKGQSKEARGIRLYFTVDRRGLLQGEILGCSLDIENNGQEIIENVWIDFVQIIYYAGFPQGSTRIVFKKDVLQVIHHEEFKGQDSGGKIHCESVMTIPKDLLPTFTMKGRQRGLEIRYFVQFCVQIAGGVPMRGDTGIVIGTTRDLVPRVNQVDMNLTNFECEEGINLLGSTSPPPYSSILFSRRASLESLPPSYDNVCDKYKENENPGQGDDWTTVHVGSTPRPRSNSIGT